MKDNHRMVRHGTGCTESYGCPIPRGAQGQAEWGPRQPELMGGNQPLQHRGWNWVIFLVLSNLSHLMIHCFYDSLILWFYENKTVII